MEAIKTNVKAQLAGNPVEVGRFTKLLGSFLTINTQYILLVGGYGESPYLRSKMREAFETDLCSVTIVDDGT